MIKYHPLCEELPCDDLIDMAIEIVFVRNGALGPVKGTILDFQRKGFGNNMFLAVRVRYSMEKLDANFSIEIGDTICWNSR